MKKTIIWILSLIALIIVFVLIFFLIKIKETGPGLPSESGLTQTHECIYVYKTNQDFFPYVAGIANNLTGEYSIINWPINYQDKELEQRYILGSGGYCELSEQSFIHDWVILDLEKSELYYSIGYPGCIELQKQTYPDCYGERNYKPGQNLECDEIYKKESISDTSICPSFEITTENIQATNVFTDFYICDYSIGNTVEEYNNIINNNQLDEFCKKLI